MITYESMTNAAETNYTPIVIEQKIRGDKVYSDLPDNEMESLIYWVTHYPEIVVEPEKWTDKLIKMSFSNKKMIKSLLKYRNQLHQDVQEGKVIWYIDTIQGYEQMMKQLKHQSEMEKEN